MEVSSMSAARKRSEQLEIGERHQAKNTKYYTFWWQEGWEENGGK